MRRDAERTNNGSGKMLSLYLDVNWKIRWAYFSRNYVNNFTSSCAHIILALMVNRFGLMSAMEGSERPFYASSDSPPTHACQIGQRARVTDLNGVMSSWGINNYSNIRKPPKNALRQQYQMERHCSGSIK